MKAKQREDEKQAEQKLLLQAAAEEHQRKEAKLEYEDKLATVRSPFVDESWSLRRYRSRRRHRRRRDPRKDRPKSRFRRSRSRFSERREDRVAHRHDVRRRDSVASAPYRRLPARVRRRIRSTSTTVRPSSSGMLPHIFRRNRIYFVRCSRRGFVESYIWIDFRGEIIRHVQYSTYVRGFQNLKQMNKAERLKNNKNPNK